MENPIKCAISYFSSSLISFAATAWYFMRSLRLVTCGATSWYCMSAAQLIIKFLTQNTVKNHNLLIIKTIKFFNDHVVTAQLTIVI